MANCPNCDAPLEDDAKFCGSCGAAIAPAEQAAAPEAPPPAPEAPAPVPEAPYPAPEAPAPEAPASETPASETIFCPNCGEPIGAALECCEHCGAALSADGGQKDKKAGGFGLKKWLVCGSIVVVAAAIVVVLISVFGWGGGKSYGLYIKEVDKEGDLYCSNLTKNGAWQVSRKLCEDADNSFFVYNCYDISNAAVMSKDGKTLFFPDKLADGFRLYYRGTASEKTEIKKLDSDITRYAVNDGASIVTYLKNGNLFQFDVKRGEKGGKLAGDVASFYVSDDGKRIIYLNSKGALYELDSGREPEQLDSNVAIRFVSDDCKTVVYLKRDSLYLRQSGKDPTEIDDDVYDTLRVYDTGEAYYLKEDRNELILCYFDGKKTCTELIDEFDVYNYYMVSASDGAPALVYRDDDDTYSLVVGGGKPRELNTEDPGGFTVSTDGRSVWYVDELDKHYEGDLYKIPVSNGTVGKAEQVDDNVYAGSVRYTSGGHLVYFKKVKDGKGELWVDGKKADNDVYLNYGMQESDSGALLYYVDYDASKGHGTLKQYSGGKDTLVADDVYDFFVLPNGSVLYLMDYSSSKYRGDLYVYSGGKSTQLDEDVVTIIPVTSNKYGWT